MRVGEGLSDSELHSFTTRRLDIESREPPTLDVLNVICHNELVVALGLQDSQLVDLTWLQRKLANIADVRPHQLRKAL